MVLTERYDLIIVHFSMLLETLLESLGSIGNSSVTGPVICE